MKEYLTLEEAYTIANPIDLINEVSK